MTSDAKTVPEYVASLAESRREIILKLLEAVRKGLPEGFQEGMNYGMIGFVVPLERYPNGYLGKKDVPLPFVHIASQKNHLALYHSALYVDANLLNWFTSVYSVTANHKLNMGKSCIRWKESHKIPYELITELMTKITLPQWIEMVEKTKGSR